MTSNASTQVAPRRRRRPARLADRTRPLTVRHRARHTARITRHGDTVVAPPALAIPIELVAMSRPAPPALTVRYDGSTRTFAPGNDVVIGRDLRADVRIAHPLISRAHLILRFDQGRWIAIDNGSLNGMYVNGRRVPAVDIPDGLQRQHRQPGRAAADLRGGPPPGFGGSTATSPPPVPVRGPAEHVLADARPPPPCAADTAAASRRATHPPESAAALPVRPRDRDRRAQPRYPSGPQPATQRAAATPVHRSSGRPSHPQPVRLR